MQKKPKIICPICHFPYIKKYFSSHMKNIHKNKEYSRVIKRGMRYNFNKENPLFMPNNKYYCEICKKAIKNNSLYVHNKSIMHLKLLNLYDKEIKSKLNKNDDLGNLAPEKKKFLDNMEINNIGLVSIISSNWKLNKKEKKEYTSKENEGRNIFKMSIISEEPIETKSVLNSLSSVPLNTINSNESSRSHISFTKISGGLIPKCFEIHHIPNVMAGEDLISDKFYIIQNEERESESDSSSDYNISKNLYEKEEILDIDELFIKQKVDNIIMKLEKRQKLSNK